MTFSEVRKYEFGDDIRSIDWNVTARYNEPFIKVFEEERELTLMLLIDVSGSKNFATRNKLKKEIVTEIAATLAFSALKNNDKVGAILFSVIQKKAIVFVLSDFIDNEYDKTLKLAAKKYDLTGIRIFDTMETKIPKLGMVPMIDAESNELVWVDTSSRKIRENYLSNYNLSIKKFESLFNKNGAGIINCMVDESYVKKLLGYFKHRA
jgi:uncharacterized protein (DUF58 family)